MNKAEKTWTQKLAYCFTYDENTDVDLHRFEEVVNDALTTTKLTQTDVDILYATIRDEKSQKEIAKEIGTYSQRVSTAKRKAISILGWPSRLHRFLIKFDPYDNCRLDEFYSDKWPGNFAAKLIPSFLSDRKRYYGIVKGTELSTRLESLIRNVADDLHPDDRYQSNLYAVVTLLYYKDGKTTKEIAVDRSLSNNAVTSIISIITNACSLHKNVHTLYYNEDAWDAQIAEALKARCYFEKDRMPLYKSGVLREHVDKLANLGIITCEDFLIDNSAALVEYLGESVYEDVSRCLIPRTKVKPSHRWDMHDTDPRNPFNKHTASHKYVETSVGRVLVPYDWTDAEVDEYIKQHTKTETKFVG